MAYQSLQASPMLPAWKLLSAGTPVVVRMRRPERPWVYSWKTIPASSAELLSGALVFIAQRLGALAHRYICICGGTPSCWTAMLALVEWELSGKPPVVGPAPGFWHSVLAVSAPSSIWVWTASWPRPCPVGLWTWKLPAAGVKPIGS